MLLSIYSDLYWLTRLDSISGFFVFLSFFGAIFVGGLSIFRGINFLERNDYVKRPWRWVFGVTILVLGILGDVLIPSKKEVIFIVAAGKTINFAQNDTSIQKMPGQASALLSNWLEKETNQLKEEIKEGKEKKTETKVDKPDTKTDVKDEKISDIIKEQVKEELKNQIKSNK